VVRSYPTFRTVGRQRGPAAGVYSERAGATNSGLERSSNIDGQPLKRMRKITFLALLGLALCLTVRAARTPQTPLATAEVPKTPPGEQFSAWLAAFNSGERAQLETFRSHYAKPEEHAVDDVFAFRPQTGGFHLEKIEDSTATAHRPGQERGSDQFARFKLEVEANTLLTAARLPPNTDTLRERPHQSQIVKRTE
jgi:hypothetical protein